MREWRLKATDEETALQVGAQLGEAMGLPITQPVLDNEGEPTGEVQWIPAGHRHFLLRVGIRYTPGEYDDDGDVITAPEPMDGWWCNLRVRDEIAEQVGQALQQAAESGVIEVESTGHEIA